MEHIVHVLRIDGMTCDGCVNRVKTVLSKALEVIDADISHESGNGRIKTRGDVSIDRVIEIVNTTGYTALEI